ncbi:hypothetical protein [Thalassobacillus hwangdonensis]|uniref:Uncharacterized protein n=1 Tax=Thalassobacillus hwangdonensis TaxID=546108 RepID=A0ABW3KZD8_9BACI
MERKIEQGKQLYLKKTHEIVINEHEITSENYRFSLHQVYDVSFKSTENETGLLYLHTNQGVLTYVMEDYPEAFIKAFNKLKERH